MPNGERANLARRKCVLPKGMPMMVMQRMIAYRICVRNIQMPPTKNHKTFMKRFRQPDGDSVAFTCEPNGQMARSPNFKACSPNGMPMMVIISTKLAHKYSRAM